MSFLKSKPKLYVGDIIVQTNPIEIPDSEETLALAEESRSKMLLKHKDNMMLEKEKQVDTTPIDYAALNQLYKDFPTRFVPQTELFAEQAFWSQNSSLKDLFSTFNQHLVDELSEVQNVFYQMEQAVEQHRIESKTFENDYRMCMNAKVSQLETDASKLESTSASGSQPSGNTKKDKIQQTPSSTLKNKVEAHPWNVKSSLKNKNSVVETKGTATMQHSKLNANSKLKCVKCNGCMLSDNHDLGVLDFINNVNARTKFVKKNSKRKVLKPT
ncbi:hypothetical protein Tco_0853051, partial [Tanacetum coccineum]